VSFNLMNAATSSPKRSSGIPICGKYFHDKIGFLKIITTYDMSLENVWMGVQKVFNFTWKQIFASTNNHFLQSSNDFSVSIFIKNELIAGLQPELICKFKFQITSKFQIFFTIYQNPKFPSFSFRRCNNPASCKILSNIVHQAVQTELHFHFHQSLLLQCDYSNTRQTLALFCFHRLEVIGTQQRLSQSNHRLIEISSL
jgi:hypothetical protein